MSEINDKSTIPLWAVASTVPFIIGFILWLSSIESKASRIIEVEDKLEIVYIMKEDLAAIKQQQLDIKEQLHEIKNIRNRRQAR